MKKNRGCCIKIVLIISMFLFTTSLTYAAPRLPGGVTSRIKKANVELGKADKAMEKGVGTKLDRALRAENYLKRAKNFRAEIDKRYADKFSPDHTDIQALDQRITALETVIAATKAPPEEVSEQEGQNPETTDTSSAQIGQTEAPQDETASSAAPAETKLPSAVTHRLKKAEAEMDKVERVLDNQNISTEARFKQADYKLSQAKTYLDEIAKRYGDQAPPDHSGMQPTTTRFGQVSEKVASLGEQVNAEQEKQLKAQTEKEETVALSHQWSEKFRPFIESDSGKSFHPYATDDQALWDNWNVIWAELKPLWEEYQTTEFPSGQTPSLKADAELLGRYIDNYKTLVTARQEKMAAASALKGDIVFSTSPINPASPTALLTSFNAGDSIYALIRVKSPWSEIYKQPKNMAVRIDVTLDGKKLHAQFITIRKETTAHQNWLRFEIAPTPGNMRAYANPDLEYGKTTANLRQGPMELCSHLAGLSGGSHRMNFSIQHYGKLYADGGFTISGSDFSHYAKLAEKAAEAVAQSSLLPQSGQTNKKIAKTMEDLLKNVGWPDIYRLNIIDKDWWLNRASGGNSAIISRHLAAAAMAKDKDGYFYKICTFEQPRLITGVWGPLELKHTGERVGVLKENKDK